MSKLGGHRLPPPSPPRSQLLIFCVLLDNLCVTVKQENTSVKQFGTDLGAQRQFRLVKTQRVKARLF